MPDYGAGRPLDEAAARHSVIVLRHEASGHRGTCLTGRLTANRLFARRAVCQVDTDPLGQPPKIVLRDIVSRNEARNAASIVPIKLVSSECGRRRLDQAPRLAPARDQFGVARRVRMPTEHQGIDQPSAANPERAQRVAEAVAARALDVLRAWSEPNRILAHSEIIAPREGEYLVKRELYSGFFRPDRNLRVRAMRTSSS
jgi:hypothetical protein